MQTFKNLLLIAVLIGSLPACELSDQDEEPVADTPIEETEEEEKLDLFHGSGYEGLFQDAERMIIIGREYGTTSSRLFRLYKNGVKDTTFNDTDLYDAQTSIIWALLRIGNDGHIILRGPFSIDGKLYKVAKLNRDGAIDRSFLSGLPAEFITDPGESSSPNLWNIVQHERFYYMFFDKHIVKLDDTGKVDESFEFRFSDNTFDRIRNVSSIHALQDGKLLVTGQFEIVYGGKTYRDLIRLFPDGRIDPSFSFQYELVEERVEYDSSYAGSAGAIYSLAEGGYLLQGNFKSLVDSNSGEEFEASRLVRLNPDFSLDKNFKFSYSVGRLNYTQLPDGRLAFFKTSLSDNRGYLVLVDNHTGTVLLERKIGREMIGGSRPIVHEGKIYLFSMFYDWFLFAPNYAESLPFLAFEIDKL